MSKLTQLTIDNVLYNLGDIQEVETLPTIVDSESTLLIYYMNQLYIRQYNGLNYSYQLLQTGDNGDTAYVEDETLYIEESIATGDVKSTQIVEDQGKLKIATYDSQGDIVNINDTPNQLLQRKLNTASKTVIIPKGETNWELDEETNDSFKKGDIVGVRFNNHDDENVTVFYGIVSSKSETFSETSTVKIRPMTLYSLRSGVVTSFSIASGYNVSTFSILHFESGRSETFELYDNNSFNFEGYDLEIDIY